MEDPDIKLSDTKLYNNENFISLRGLLVSLWQYIYRMVHGILLAARSLLALSFSANYEITLPMSRIIMIFFVTFAVCLFFVRYKVLTRYSAKTHTSFTSKAKRAEGNIDLDESIRKRKHMVNNHGTNYLDEFLRAIKIFGYLEGPVFNELTKNMTTQKLDEDEILFLDETLGFLIVVEGSLKLYTRTNSTSLDRHSLDFESDKDEFVKVGDQIYQLINEVKSGSPLSSLVSTLELFQSSKPLMDDYDTSSHISSSQLSPQCTGDLDNKESLKNYSIEGAFYPEIIAKPNKTQNRKGSKATVSIIPASAFRKIYQRYPKATAHIVAIVLTRLYKVTLNTIHSYIGLTEDIMHTEALLNSAVDPSVLLPGYLEDGVVERLKNGGKENALESSQIQPSRSTLHTEISRQSVPIERQSSSRYVVLDSRSKLSHPGDLLSSVPLSRRSDYYQSHTFSPHEASRGSELDNTKERQKENKARRKSLENFTFPSKNSSTLLDINQMFVNEREETEESSLRIALVEIIFKMIGIKEGHFEIQKEGSISGLSSRDSSAVGLQAFEAQDRRPKTRQSSLMCLKDEAQIQFPSPIRFDVPPNREQRVYRTITSGDNKSSSLINVNSMEKNGRIKNKLHQKLAEFDFQQIKSEFGRSLDISYFEADTTIIERDSFDTALYYVIDGSLDVYQTLDDKFINSNKPKEQRLYLVKKRQLTGYLSTVIGFRSLVTIRTPKDQGVILASISRKDFSKLIDKFYFLQLPVALKLKSLLPNKIRIIDFALEWCHIPAGDVLCAQGDMANGFHIVLSGRFRAVTYTENKPSEGENSKSTLFTDDTLVDLPDSSRRATSKDYTVLGEYGHGESIGEVEVLTASRRTNSLIAVRDSETARIPRNLFEMLSLQNPSFMVKVSRIVAQKMAASQNNMSLQGQQNVPLILSATRSHICNDYKTITILPTVDGLPVREFSLRLVQALKTIGRKVIELDHATILTHLGRHAFDERLAQLKLSGYFAYLEEVFETVVYVCDTAVKSDWTSACISQGDCILLLADADDFSVALDMGEFERVLVKLKTIARTDLCLIHRTKYVEPGTTSMWLENRDWVQGHHHIQMEIDRKNVQDTDTKKSLIRDLAAKITNKANPNIRSKIENVKGKAISSFNRMNSRLRLGHIDQNESFQPLKNDFLRLARILSNEAVGLVLGGGGSRGISHVGVVAALEKHGIPIDLVGGTSIGSLVGGLYARDYNTVSVYARTKQFARRISSLWRMALDLTYPITSYTTGYEFNRGIWKIFRSYEIEDFWIKYYCNSTNITNSTMDIHETGYLWRFIRASMSLAGLLPPITYNGCMLLDGGYLDNLPVMEMKKKGAKYIIAVDVGSVDDRTPMNYGDTLSGFWVWINRWNPFSKYPNIPNMMDIQLRLAYVASVNALEVSKKIPGIIYLRPPIEDYATLDFAKFDEIYHVGYAYADSTLKKWEEMKKIPLIAGRIDKSHLAKGYRKLLFRRNSI